MISQLLDLFCSSVKIPSFFEEIMKIVDQSGSQEDEVVANKLLVIYCSLGLTEKQEQQEKFMKEKNIRMRIEGRV